MFSFRNCTVMVNTDQKCRKSMNIKNNEYLQCYLYTFIFQDAITVAQKAIWPVIVRIFCNYIYEGGLISNAS